MAAVRSKSNNELVSHLSASCSPFAWVIRQIVVWLFGLILFRWWRELRFRSISRRFILNRMHSVFFYRMSASFCCFCHDLFQIKFDSFFLVLVVWDFVLDDWNKEEINRKLCVSFHSAVKFRGMQWKKLRNQRFGEQLTKFVRKSIWKVSKEINLRKKIVSSVPLQCIFNLHRWKTLYLHLKW